MGVMLNIVLGLLTFKESLAHAGRIPIIIMNQMKMVGIMGQNIA